ncbi:hypothetical protein [Klebsiella sp. BIGb0407]|uniref:hypothetical protein n=1 Tax=Klebsiella sp. BIGb0407 TaxID=2940603 RepID=UPI0021688218|nr:hypothetical protein [Klebsiella sp. BIGb0407]MCS3429594.1 hypothetical protein [Klebsiella sp. BIGb0407]
MSFNVGNGLLTAHISYERLHDIKNNEFLPEMTLWEKIKDFFFSTHQKAAYECVHKLYHRDDFNMSEQDVRETFINLRQLASPGCKNKFIIDSNIYKDVYKIDSEVILSCPNPNLHEHRIWSDTDDEDDDDILQNDNNEQPTASEISLLQQRKISAPERDFLLVDNVDVQNFKILKSKIEETIRTIGVFKIIDSGGYSKLFEALDISNRIIKNLHEPNNNRQAFYNNIDALLKISEGLNLVAPDITRMPEFTAIQSSFAG